MSKKEKEKQNELLSGNQPCSTVLTGEAMMAMAYCAVSGPYSLSRLVFWIRTR